MSKFIVFIVMSISAFSSMAGTYTLQCDADNGVSGNLSDLLNVAEAATDEPTILNRNQMDDICSAILNKSPPTKIYVGVSYAYQEKMWKYAGLQLHDYIRTGDRPKDRGDMDAIIQAAKPVMQKFWLANREKFTCSNTSNLANGKNITKYVLESGFTSFLTEAASRYQMDMNFVDPIDKISILQYIEMRTAVIQKSDPEKAEEFRQIAELLRDKGAN